MAFPADRVLRERKPTSFFQLAPIQLSKPKKSKSDINRDYYQRVKADDVKYKERLETQKEKSKRNRQEIKDDPEKLERSRKLAAERVRKYRQRLKEKEAIEVDRAPKVVTRKDAEVLSKKREKDRLRKQAERAKWSHQKRSAENKKAAARYHQKIEAKAKSSLDRESSQEEAEVNGGDLRSQNARHQAVHRVVSRLPKEPAARQQTLEDLFKNYEKAKSSDPDPRVHLSRKDKRLTRDLVKKLWVSRKHLKRGVFHTITTLFGLSRSRVSYHTRPKLQENANVKREAVRKFYEENSRTLSEKRHSQKSEQPSVLEEPIEELFDKFLHQSEVKVGKSFFFKHRPRHIKKMSEVKFNQSLCELCRNFTLLCKTLGSINPFFNRSKQHIVDFFLCDKEGRYNNKTCIERSCDSCKSPALGSFFSQDELDKAVTVNQWLYRETDRGVKRKVLVPERSTIQQCLEMFEEQMKIMPKHLYIAQWQYANFLHQTKYVKDGELVTVMDFAENYRCANQDEVQAAYWNYQQATIHPMVNYLKCPNCSSIRTATVVAISDDLQHDHHAVEAFYQKNVDFFNSTPLRELTQWSDGCGVQYKSKGPFTNLQAAPKRYCVKRVNRHFFGSRHGKNPSDGVSANVKNKASRAVRCRRALIQTAKDLYLFLESNMTMSAAPCERHNSRHFVFVAKEDIEREPATYISLKGTRQVHCLKTDGDCLHYRNLTCLCEGCTNDNPASCGNAQHVKEWQTQDMLPTQSSERSSASEPNGGQSTNSSLVLLSQSSMELLEELNEELGTGVTELTMTGVEEVPKQDELVQPEESVRPEEQQEEPTSHKEVGRGVTELAMTGVEEVPKQDELVQPEESVRPEEQQEEPTSHKSANTILPGSWVAASFPGKTMKVYLGTVLEVDGNEASIKFGRQTSRNIFTWPRVEDIGWMPLYSLTPLDAPQMDSRERMFLAEDLFTKYFDKI